MSDIVPTIKNINAKGRRMMIKSISRENLKTKIERGGDFKLVETLSEHNYHHAHLPGAINIPPDQITDLAPEILPDKSAEIIVYCAKPT